MTIAVLADIDGVFHPSTSILGLDLPILALQGADAIRKKGLFKWTPQLEQILAAAEANSGREVGLVIHSSWRNQGWATQSLMRELLGPLGHRFLGYTQSGLARQQSIEDFLDRSGTEEYIIVDDASGEFAPGTPNLVVTNPLLGVSDPATIYQLRSWSCSFSTNNLCVPTP